MRKNDLKKSLGRIQPREELVQTTLNKVNEQKDRQSRCSFNPSYSFNVRLVGALCVLVLMIGIGFVAARQMQSPDVSNPASRTLGQLATTEAGTDSANIVNFTSYDEYENGWIVINGKIESLSFTELSESDKANGAIRSCKVKITAHGLVDQSDNLTADLNKTSAEFEADVVFYNSDIMNRFFDQSTDEMIIRLTPGDDGNWSIIDFKPFEK